jgi:hypothetical protein
VVAVFLEGGFSELEFSIWCAGASVCRDLMVVCVALIARRLHVGCKSRARSVLEHGLFSSSVQTCFDFFVGSE